MAVAATTSVGDDLIWSRCDRLARSSSYDEETAVWQAAAVAEKTLHSSCSGQDDSQPVCTETES